MSARLELEAVAGLRLAGLRAIERAELVAAARKPSPNFLSALQLTGHVHCASGVQGELSRMSSRSLVAKSPFSERKKT